MQPSFDTFRPYPQPGEVLDGKYRIERILGEGGMGAVAKATHLLRRAPVALKFMSGGVLSLAGSVERFVNEGVAASQIDSDHVVKIYDVCRMPSGAPFLVMEYLEGSDLGQILAQEGRRLEPPRSVHFALQMLRALQTAHGAGIIHRDMKPSNCFVINKDGEPDFVKLVDFGISKVRSTEDGKGQTAHLTRTNSALGTPLYMSPEQARSPRDVDHRTDLYSVGAILYETLAGRTPYIAESDAYTELLFKIFTTDPEPLRALRPDLPEGLVAAVTRALTRDPDARFGSANEMAESLAPFADERSANLVARLGGRARGSWLPPLSVSPPPPASRTPPPPAGAQTFPAHDSRRPATDVGVSREQAGAAPSQTRPRSAVVAGGAAAVLLAGTVGLFVALRSTHPAPATPSAPAVTASPSSAATALPPASPSAAGPATTSIEPTAASGAETLPPPSAVGIDGSAPSARPSFAEPLRPARSGAAAPGASSAPPPSQLPHDLRDIRLH